jgi:outer membrane protein assembly factor BamB
VSANRGGFVGNRYESLPRGVTYVSGAVLATTRGGPEYELARLQTPRGEMIWFDSLSHTSRATPTRVVRAELKVPPLSRDERVFLASCDVSGKLDDHVVAIVVNEPNVTKFTKIRQAWRVNVERGQFELIPVAGITCEEPGAG